MSDKAPFISFPPGYLGSRPVKFPLLADNDRFIALNKPARMACYQHDWSQGLPDVSMALRRELLAEKPQLKKLGIEGVFRIYNFEADASGVLIYAKTEEQEELLRNALGSRQIVFVHHLLVRSETEEREIYCDLPIAKHFREPRALVSHKTGKKCETMFRYLRPFGQYQLWEAESRDMRLHQVRLHAAERGLSIVGDECYAKGEQIYLSNLKRGYRQSGKRERPLYEELCLHLVQVRFEIPYHKIDSVEAPLPARFETLLKRLDEHRAWGA